MPSDPVDIEVVEEASAEESDEASAEESDGVVKLSCQVRLTKVLCPSQVYEREMMIVMMMMMSINLMITTQIVMVPG
jgi:hypothetical protein